MRLEELGKEGFKLWVIWSNTSLAKRIRAFVFYAAYATLVGWLIAYCWALWTPSIFIAPFVIWFLMYNVPLMIIRREGRMALAERQKQQQELVELYEKRRIKRLEFLKRKEEEKLTKGRKPNR